MRMSAPSRSGHPKRQRQERTVYTKVQLEMLEKFFKKNEFPGYQDRLRLAASLRLEEHKVQVWFKNRRAKRSRLERLAKGQGQGAPDAPTDPGAPGAPGPAPAPAPVVVAAAAAAAARPAFPEDPGFWRPPPPSPAGMLPAPEPSVSSGDPALWGPAQGARAEVLAVPAPVPAPAPGWPQDPYDPTFCPGSCPVPDFTKIFSRQDPSQEGPPPLLSGHQNGDDSLDENDLGPGFMNL